MQVQLRLILSLIVEAVKAETFIKGTVDRAIDEKANALSYHETAGDEQVHERKIMRGIYTSADKLKSFLIDYLSNGSAYTGDNFVADIDTDNDAINIKLDVNKRYNAANNDSLARLCSKFIEDNTLVLWWGTINQQQTAYYQSLLTEDISAIQRMFIKRAPDVPSPTYTQSIGGVSASVELLVGESDTVTYTTDSGKMDDVECYSDDEEVVIVNRIDDVFELYGAGEGVANVTLYSRHNSDVKKLIQVTVREE